MGRVTSAILRERVAVMWRCGGTGVSIGEGKEMVKQANLKYEEEWR